jgi:uncharacterized protein (TIGR02996 family)
MSATEQDLLAAIWARPLEDAPRLMYADWLTENGHAERADLIRAQCELARIPEDDPKARKLRGAAQRALRGNEGKWKAHLPNHLKSGDWHRGFFQPRDSRHESVSLVQRLTPEEWHLVPTRRWHLYDAVARFDELLACPNLDRLERFHLHDGVPTGDWVARAVACVGFRNVCRASLVACPVGWAEVGALLTAWADHGIVELNLNRTPLGVDGLARLLAHPALATVRDLYLRESGLTAEGARALAASAFRLPEPRLDFADNPLGDAGLEALLAWREFPRLQSLVLNCTRLSDAGACALAACKGARALRRLWLGTNDIGETGARALADSPHLKNLEELYLHENPIPTAALLVLRERFGDALKTPTTFG